MATTVVLAVLVGWFAPLCSSIYCEVKSGAEHCALQCQRNSACQACVRSATCTGHLYTCRTSGEVTRLWLPAVSFRAGNPGRKTVFTIWPLEFCTMDILPTPKTRDDFFFFERKWNGVRRREEKAALPLGGPARPGQGLLLSIPGRSQDGLGNPLLPETGGEGGQPTPGANGG